jgi:hypothetical protein
MLTCSTHQQPIADAPWESYRPFTRRRSVFGPPSPCPPGENRTAPALVSTAAGSSFSPPSAPPVSTISPAGGVHCMVSPFCTEAPEQFVAGRGLFNEPPGAGYPKAPPRVRVTTMTTQRVACGDPIRKRQRHRTADPPGTVWRQHRARRKSCPWATASRATAPGLPPPGSRIAGRPECQGPSGLRRAG